MRTMFEMIDNNPFYKLFWLLLVGAAVFLIVLVMKRYVLALVKDEFQQGLIRRWEYRVVTLVWLVYGSWALYHLIKSNFIVTLTILGVVMIAGWRNWMEFFSGIFLRLERRIQIGDLLQTDHGSGRVERFFFQSLALHTDEGQIVHLPYSKITGDVVAQSTDQEKLLAQSFTVQHPSDDPHSIKQRISMLVYRCPWTAVLHPVNVTHSENDTYKITARTIDKADFYRLESYVQKRLKTGK